VNISFAFQAIEKLFIHLTNLCFVEFCKFLGDFWGYLEEIVFLNGLVKFREIRNGVDLM